MNRLVSGRVAHPMEVQSCLMIEKTVNLKGGANRSPFFVNYRLSYLIEVMYLAFRKVDLKRLLEALRDINGAVLVPAVLIVFVSHWFRAVRHGHLLAPIKRIKNSSLFSALMIGYMANTILPAHLGELLRAYVIGKNERVSGSSTLATIAVERVVDVLSLLIIMGLVFMVYPFPDIVRLSAYLTIVFIVVIIGFLAFVKMKPKETLRFAGILTKPLPGKAGNRLLELLESFREGVVALNNRQSYLIVFVLTIVIWICYVVVFALGFYAFDFVETYKVPLDASFVLLVITTISVLVPSSPGYVGTYHWLCVISLGMFAVPKSPALGYAIVIHAVTFIPVALIGIAFSLKEGIKISKIGMQRKLDMKDM
jgi:uncharacterized protein (TIRG00374 family)